MRICIMIDSWPANFIAGGGHVAVWEMARRLVKNHNCDIDLIVGTQCIADRSRPPRIENYLDGRLRLIRVNPWCIEHTSLLGKLVYCVASIPFMIRTHYDLINAQAFASGLPGWVAGRLTKTPVVFTIQGIGIRSMTAMVTNRLQAWLLQNLEILLLFKMRYDHQISVSRDIFDYPNVNRRITIIPNGVNVDEFEAVESQKANSFQILFVGRFHPQKGLVYLIEAIGQVVKKHPRIKVLLVGSGDQERELRDQINEQGMESYFEFTGHLTGVEKIKAFKSSHLFVLPSLYEGQPLTLLEAWAAKLPVVVTSVGANPDFVEDGVNGYMTPPKRSDLLAQAIIRAIENPSLAALGECGYALVQRQYSWDSVAAQTYQVYQNLCAGNGST